MCTHAGYHWGMPSGPKQRALKLAEDLITSPGSSRPAGQGVEREAGYVVLGALCASGLPKAQKVENCEERRLLEHLHSAMQHS